MESEDQSTLQGLFRRLHCSVSIHKKACTLHYPCSVSFEDAAISFIAYSQIVGSYNQS